MANNIGRFNLSDEISRIGFGRERKFNKFINENIMNHNS